MLTSRSIGTHSHLAPKQKKHAHAHTENSESLKKESPFGKLQFGNSAEPMQSAYKPIFKI